MAMRRMDISDLQAKEEAYGHRLTTSRIIQMISVYGLTIGFYSYILYVNWFITVILTILTLIYAYYSILMREVNSRYYRNGLDQRHEFVNIMTLALTNLNNTPLTALNQSIQSMTGEFKEDLTGLSAAMKQNGGSSSQTHNAFLRLQSKYKDDVIFCQYLDQIETAFDKGRLNPQVFQDLANNHDHMYSKQEEFIQGKNSQKYLMYEFLVVIWLFIAGVAAKGFGWDTYLRTFAHSYIGFGFSTAFMVVLIVIVAKFLKYYYDESITTL